MSRAALARTAAAQLSAVGMPLGACAGRSRLWSLLEWAHRRSSKPDEAAEVIAVIRGEFCDSCPALRACRNFAQTAGYTGLAAGKAYEEGQEQEPTWVAPRPGRVARRSAS